MLKCTGHSGAEFLSDVDCVDNKPSIATTAVPRDALRSL
jgi:hypothetical protein